MDFKEAMQLLRTVLEEVMVSTLSSEYRIHLTLLWRSGLLSEIEPGVSVRQAAKIHGVATSTVHRWLNDGFIDGEPITPGAPWRIRITDAFRPRLMEKTPPGYVSMFQAMQNLGVTRQTVMQRVNRGELDAIHIRTGSAFVRATVVSRCSAQPMSRPDTARTRTSVAGKSASAINHTSIKRTAYSRSAIFRPSATGTVAYYGVC